MITPRFSLNFTTAVLDSNVTFARTTSASNPATYVNSSGVITAATNNEPRFNFDPVTLVCKGLLIEESRINRALASAGMANASYWTATRASWPGTTITAPDGTNTGQKLVEDSSATTTHIGLSFANITTVASTTYTISVYAKAGERNWFQMQEGQTVTASAYFNLETGAVGTVAGTGSPSASIANAGGGWYRCSLTFTTTGTAARIRMYLATGNGGASYTGNGTSGAYFWGAQLEAGAFATSYIPTTTAILTRNADVATITGANFSSWWVASQGGVTANFRPSTVSGTRPIIQYDDGTANEIITLRGNTTNPELYIVDGGAPQAQIDAGTIAANTDYSLTGWWQTNDCRAKLGSGAQVIDNTATIPTVTQARIGSDGTNYLNGTIASISYYDSFTSQIYNRRKNKAIFSLM